MRSAKPSSARTTAPTLAAALIVRDESRCIARCLDSIRPWVDHMVVVDTGSTDDTVALAKRSGGEVHHFAWPDDFSVARNHALALADADWTLVIDADECLLSGGELLRPWCAGAPRLGKLCVHNALDAPPGTPTDQPLPISRSWLTRLLPRGVRYEGRIHEQPASRLPRARIDLHLHHDGYLKGQMAEKQNRNLPLLLLDLGDNPDDPYTHYQLGREAERRERHADASDHYRQAFARTADDANWLHDLMIRYIYSLSQAGQLHEAIALATDHMERWQDSPDFFFLLGNLMVDRATDDPGNALSQWLPFADAAWERCLDIGERPELEGSVQGRGSHLARHNLNMMRAQMALLVA